MMEEPAYKELKQKLKELEEAFLKYARVEELLQENEQRLRAILEGYPSPTFVIGTNHRVLYWNKALEELSGIRADDAIGKNEQWKVFYKEAKPTMADLLLSGRTDEIAVQYAGKYNKSDLHDEAYEAVDYFPDLGSDGKWLRFTAAALRDSKGTLFGAIETLKDVTDYRIAGDALRDSEQRLRAILEGSPIPTFVIGPNHKVLYWNRALEELTGIKSESAVGQKQHWKAFYREKRPGMADLLVDGRSDEISVWYAGKCKKSNLIDGAYEAVDFFPELSEGKGKWLRFTAAVLRDSQDNLIGAIETLEDITDRKVAESALVESEERYRELSITDALTKLYNSRHFIHQLRAEIERANRYKHSLSLLLLDIDNFKHYNDTYGHLEGDTVLVKLGEVMRRCLRKTDSAYRFGGEEFTAILPETGGDDAKTLAERIRQEFKHESFTPRGDSVVHKTISIGVTEYVLRESLTDFLRRADESMYIAKEKGKNTVFYQP